MAIKQTLTVTRKFIFDSAHFLPDHQGKCVNMHGHRYELFVTIGGNMEREDSGKPNSGMIIDFGDLKNIVEEIVLEPFDHNVINNILHVPTAEVMAIYITDALEAPLGELGVHVVEVKLWENEKSFATVKVEEV